MTWQSGLPRGVGVRSPRLRSSVVTLALVTENGLDSRTLIRQSNNRSLSGCQVEDSRMEPAESAVIVMATDLPCQPSNWL